jgi:hypothetical protein
MAMPRREAIAQLRQRVATLRGNRELTPEERERFGLE